MKDKNNNKKKEKIKSVKKTDNIKIVNNSNKNRVVIILIVIISIITLALIIVPAKNKVTTCSNTIDQSKSGYKIKNKYKIVSKKDVTRSVEITNKIESTNKTVLSYLEKQYNNMYKEQNKKYGGYTIKTEKNKNSVIITVKVDYTKVKLSKLTEDNQNIKEYIKNNKLSLEGAKSIYTNLGATCDK